MWPLIEHQIENARLLATVDKGRPRPASLRRAVSTAYYAVFQALCGACADRLVGWDKPWDLFTPVFRAPDHRGASNTLLQSTLATTTEMHRLALLFRELLDAREWADYNPEPRPGYDAAKNNSSFTRQETLKLIESAVEAIGIINRLDKESSLKLAIRLAVRPMRQSNS